MSFWQVAGPILGQLAANVISGVLQGGQADSNTKANINFQREFATHGIQWKAEDARDAGLHPLAALGTNTTSFTPQSVFTTDYGVGKMGQDISRAIRATQTKEDKYREAIDTQIKREQLQRMQLENLGLLKKIKESNNPSMPSLNDDRYNIVEGQDTGIGVTSEDLQTGSVQLIPTQVPFQKRLGIQAGDLPLERDAINEDGTIYTVPSKDLEEAMESDWFTQGKYSVGKIMDYLKGIHSRWANPFTDAAWNWRAKMRKRRPKIYTDKDGQKYYYPFSVVRGSFVRTPVPRLRKGQSLDFYGHNKPWGYHVAY